MGASLETIGNRVRELFFEAVETGTTDPADFIARRCRDLPPGERSDLLDLLRAHQSAGQFMAEPTFDDNSGPSNFSSKPAELPVSVGPYRVIRELGEGGFGSVYLAEQARPVRRQVALKVIKPGMDSRQVLLRFDAERQVLALMEHPNVARVFDAGTTEAGRPWFAMERVDGPPITAYVQGRRLSLAATLELFLGVCRGVGHAHQKGVIHRDIKPANVLVAEIDTRPVAKVIDFGIAKALHENLIDYTATADPLRGIGTPQYMSPEQAGGPGTIDVRTDVYALGVMLYELLTGLPPVDPERLRSADPFERLRIVREEEFPTPSRRLEQYLQSAGPGSRAAAEGARRSGEIRDLEIRVREIRGELDWITTRATEKDQDRRYGSVAELADDIERYLSDRPLRAVPPTLVYRTTKFVRRNRVAVVAAATVLLAVLVGGSLAAAGYLRARDERAERVRQEQVSAASLQLADERKLRAAQAEAAAAYQGSLVVSAQGALSALCLPLANETDEQRAASIERLSHLADRLDKGTVDPPDELAGPLEAALAFSFNAYGQAARAEDRARKSVAILRRLGTAYREKLGMTLTILASAIAGQKRYDEADTAFKEAVDVFSETDPQSGGCRRPGALLNLAINRINAGNELAAVETAEEAIAATVALPDRRQEERQYARSVSKAFARRGNEPMARMYAERAEAVPVE
ncbi:serine/threonine protein kinase [Humisphaera borealis]|uniref:Serine/threonine protein kinase n=1 Tax=Humisphaera borealis TaxID=2807512 RepID=A0A7M2X4B1_9BACT|nr:serine/threonine-protein kinase [Humisphaera borealis]QOV91881.1 serine/threonine protein kinase [Humisphaera borealis]